MSRVVVIVAFLALVHGVDSIDALEPKPEKAEPSVWMRHKLDRSKDILEGLAQGDFDKIAKAAQALKVLSKVEAFARGDVSGYRRHLENFEDAVDEISNQANNDNLEGATLAFQQLTTSCVKCHAQIRKAKR
jgi:soluble cytochrome b562